MRMLMCEPRYFGVLYEINPWMKVTNQPDLALAARQWENLRSKLVGLGVQVETIPPREGLPDMVFTANGGFACGDMFVCSNFRYPQRRPESDRFAQWFAERGYRIARLPPDHSFEGAGDVKMYGDLLFGGFHYRSDIHTHLALGDQVGREVISLELVDPRFYHLDTCFAPLDDRTVMYYAPALAEYSVRTIRRHTAFQIEVGQADALDFACNCLAVGRTVVVNRASDALRQQLSEHEFDVVEAGTSEFMKSGGSVACMTLSL